MFSSFKLAIVKRIGFFLAASLLFLLFYFSLTSQLALIDKIQAHIKAQPLFQENDHYFISQENRAKEDFLRFSEMASVTSVFKSTEVGFSLIADVKISPGQSLQLLESSLQKLALVTLLSWFLTRFLELLCTMSVLITSYGVPLMILLLACACFFRGLGGRLYELQAVFLKGLKQLVLIILIFHLIIPYSIHSASIISRALIHDVPQGDIHEHADFYQRLGEKVSEGHVKGLLGHDLSELRHLSSLLEEDGKKLASKFVDEVIGFFFHQLLLPLLVFILIMKLFNRFWGFIKRLFGSLTTVAPNNSSRGNSRTDSRRHEGDLVFKVGSPEFNFVGSITSYDPELDPEKRQSSPKYY